MLEQVFFILCRLLISYKYNYNNNIIRIYNFLVEGRSRDYQVFHPFKITRRKKSYRNIIKNKIYIYIYN